MPIADWLWNYGLIALIGAASYAMDHFGRTRTINDNSLENSYFFQMQDKQQEFLKQREKLKYVSQNTIAKKVSISSSIISLCSS